MAVRIKGHFLVLSMEKTEKKKKKKQETNKFWCLEISEEKASCVHYAKVF